MGKSKKDNIKRKGWNEGFDSLSPKEQYFYPGIKGKKFKPSAGRALGITKLGKLVARNANRSVIKATRQKAKAQIIKDIIE